MEYINRLRYKGTIPTLATSSGLVNSAVFDNMGVIGDPEPPTPTTYNLVLHHSGNGSITAPQTTGFTTGDVVTVTATPDSGWYIFNWGVAGTSTFSQTGNTMTFTFENGDVTISCNFLEEATQTYNLILNQTSGGTISAPQTTGFTSGDTVVVTASADAGYALNDWNISLATDYVQSGNDVTLTFGESDIVVYANFVAVTPVDDYSTQYLTIESLEDNNTITFNKSRGSDITYYWSTDNGATWTSHNDTSSQTLNTGDKLLMKCTCNQLGTGMSNYWWFSSTNTFNVYGNIMSLLYGDNFVGQTTLPNYSYIFNKLFFNCNNLISAENLVLPATTLAEYCYSRMFQGCTRLTIVPELPATTLANSCYYFMFVSCSSLTTAPTLNATTLVDQCYRGMFGQCSSLTTITCLATDITASNCVIDWFKNVAASGTFYKNPSMSSWPTGTAGIPEGWTVVDYAA